jgi:hypothetical protein
MVAKIIKILVLTIITGLLAVSSYFLYLSILDFTAEPIPFIQTEAQLPPQKNQSSFSEQFQFYPNMRFAKKSLIYNIGDSCPENKKTRMRQAFARIEEETGLLNFYQNINPKKADILASCNKTETQIQEKYFIVGEGGPTHLINTSLFYIIEEGKVLLFYAKSKCDNYNVELHELLHIFGFKHSNNKESIMYNTTFCNQVLTDDIVEELKRLYSIEELPDLYFSRISATKSGALLSFEAEVRNQGLSNSDDVMLKLYSKGEKVDDFDLGRINYGEGKILQVKNIKLPSRKIDSIKFILADSEELYNENNIAELYLPSA